MDLEWPTIIHNPYEFQIHMGNGFYMDLKSIWIMDFFMDLKSIWIMDFLWIWNPYGLWIFYGFEIHMDYGFFMDLKSIWIMDFLWIWNPYGLWIFYGFEIHMATLAVLTS